MEELYAGTRTIVYRGQRQVDQHRLLINLLRNEFPTFSELLQFQNQYAIAKNLNLSGIIQPYSLEPYGNGNGYIYIYVMEDFGGVSLNQWKRRVGEWGRKSDFFSIALQLVDTLHQLHQQRVIHKDLKPANILIHPETQQVKLIDFSISSLLPRETQEIQNPTVLEGILKVTIWNKSY
ncbi:serine/threonine protein kinase [Leptolyngbyaceae cyanobacterium UHCC 1019]